MPADKVKTSKKKHKNKIDLKVGTLYESIADTKSFVPWFDGENKLHFLDDGELLVYLGEHLIAGGTLGVGWVCLDQYGKRIVTYNSEFQYALKEIIVSSKGNTT